MLEQAFRELNWEENGILVNGKRLTNLKFADDIILISGSLTELKDMLLDLESECRAVGLEINMSKTKLMLKNKDFENVENVNVYKYLGQTMAM